MAADNCPDIEDVRRLLLGAASDAEAARLEPHLLHCRRCLEVAEALAGDDGLVAAMRAQRSVPPNPDRTAIEEMIGRLEDLPAASLLSGVRTVAESGPETDGQSGEAPFPSTPVIPGYEVLGELGRGGMGVVYRARHVGLNRVVALKMILVGEHRRARELERFRIETEVVARLQHPHIVQIFEVGEAGGLPYCALEYCAGGSLADRLRAGPLTVDEAILLLEQLADAVHAAHQAGVVHRDLKPANILFAACGLAADAKPQAAWTPKISDFGLAKRLDVADGQTQSGDLLGTPSYMAPEQADGRLAEVGPHTDTYALGVILYELLTGRPPFRAATVVETLDLVRSAEPVPPRQLRPHCPRDLETICLKCLRKDPAKRYACARDLADDLRRCRIGEPIRARPVGGLERSLRWLRRRPALALLAAVSAVAVALVLVLSFWFSHRLGQVQGEAAGAQALADTKEFFGLISRVRERGARPQPGWTWENVADLAQAARLAPAVDHRAELRGEVAEALGTIDVRPLAVVGAGFDADCVAFHPDGRRLALGQAKAGAGLFCAVQLVDLERPATHLALPFRPLPIWRGTRELVADGVRTLAFSPDGRWLVAGTRSGMLHRWDLTRDPPALACWPGHQEEVNWLVFGGDGTALYSASHTDRTVKRWLVGAWDSPGWDQKPDRAHEASADLVGLARHPAEGWLACATRDDKIHFLSADTLQPLRPALPRLAFQIQFTPDGSCLVSGANWLIPFLALRSGRPLRDLRGFESEQGGDDPMTSLAFSPDGALLLANGTESKRVRLWEVAGGRQRADLSLGGGAVKTAFAPDGRRFAVTADGRTQLYEIGGLDDQTFVALQPHPIAAACLHADGRSVACLAVAPESLGEVTLWPLDGRAARAPSARHTFIEDEFVGRGRPGLALAPGSGLVAYTRRDVLDLWESAGEKPLRTLPTAPDLQARLSFAADSRLWGKMGSEVRAWEPAAGRQVLRWTDALSGVLSGMDAVYSLAAGRERVVVGGRNGAVYLLRAADATTETSRRVADNPVRSVALSPGETLAAGGTDKGELRLLRVPGGAVVAENAAHGDRVEALAFGGDRLLASGGRDRTIRLWRCDGSTLRELLTLRTSAPVRWLAFHPDGVRLFVLLDQERAVRVWHLDRLRTRLDALGLGRDLELLEPAPLPPPVPVARPPDPVVDAPKGPNGLHGELFADMHLQRCVKVRYDAPLAWFWGRGSPDPVLPSDCFSARWTGWLKAPAAGRYRFRLESDDGARLWLDGRLLIDRWQEGAGWHEADVDLSGRPHAVRIEYFQGTGPAGLCFSWAQAHGFSMQPVPASALFHDRAAAE
jgi:WD40 repeat protein